MDLYVRLGGKIVFVMPRSIMVAEQHARFNEFDFSSNTDDQDQLPVKIEKILDLEGVSPIFNVPSCVLIATKSPETTWPVAGAEYSGSLTGHNLSFEMAQEQITSSPSSFDRIDGVVLSEEQANELRPVLGSSYYRDRVAQGATITPRALWFVRKVDQAGGFAADKPLIEADPEILEHHTRPQWRIEARESVESRFLFTTLIPADLLPFGQCGLKQVALPVGSESDRFTVFDVQGLVEQGAMGTASWLRAAQLHWEERSPQDGLGRPKIPRIINRLNYQNTLSNQRPDQQYTVLYNGRGSNLTSVVIDSEAAGIDAGLEQSGFVVDHGCYWYSCDDPEEAYFLSAVLNSPELDRLLKLIQTRGLWGARDIHRKVWKFRIPRYESTEPRHRELAEIGLRCHNVVKPLGYDLKDRSQSTGRRRAEVRTILESELESIDAVVRGLLRN